MPLRDRSGPSWLNASTWSERPKYLLRFIGTCRILGCTHSAHTLTRQVFLGRCNEVWFHRFPSPPFGFPLFHPLPLHTLLFPLSFHAFPCFMSCHLTPFFLLCAQWSGFGEACVCVPLEITGIPSDCDDSFSFSARGMRPSRKRMPTKLCVSDQPGVPACLNCCPSCYSTSSCKVLVGSAEVHGPSSLSIDRFAVLHFGTLTFGGVNIWSSGDLNPVSLGFSLRLA